MPEAPHDPEAPAPTQERYYRELAAFEAKEKDWAETEALLRRVLSRLSLVAKGLHPELDPLLERLRTTLRQSLQRAALEDVAESITRVVLTMEEDGGGRAATPPSPGAGVARLLDQIGLPSALRVEVASVRQRLLSASDEADMDGAVGAAVALLERAWPPSTSGPETDAKRPRLGRLANWLHGASAPANTGSEAALNEIIVAFLDRLGFSGEQQPRVEALKRRLEQPLTAPQASELLEQVADLVAELRAQVHREQQDMQGFLAQLTERLQEIDQTLGESTSARDQARRRGEDLNQSVQTEVSHIEASVRQAANLSQLKQSIQQRLETIRSHMETFRRVEEEHQLQAEAEVQRLTRRLHDLESESEALQERVRQQRDQALRDPLTEIANRLACDERLAQEFARWKRFKAPVGVLVLDVDHFKAINDTYGHKAGDRVLKTIAEQLAARLRETDFVGRFGGEEFLVLMPGTPLEAALAVTEELRESIGNCGFHYRGTPVKITVSCGVTAFRDGDTAEQAFERADAAMYAAKQGGRNRSVGQG